MRIKKDIRVTRIDELVINFQNSYQEKLTDTALFNWYKYLLQHEANLKVGASRNS